MKILRIIFIIAAVGAGLYAIYSLSPSVEIALSFFTLSLGLLAIIWSLNAYTSLSPNSSLREFTFLFLLSLIFILLNTIWSTIKTVFNIFEGVNYPSYFFISLAFILFVATAYKILIVGKEFGFRIQAEEIQRVVGAVRKKLK